MNFGTKPNKEYHLTSKDGRYMLLILVLYGLLSFFHLGSLTNPQTFWQPEDSKSRVVLDLGAERQVSKLRIYTGARFGNFKLAISDDNQSFRQLEDLEEKKVFYWKDTVLDERCRYLAITPADADKIGEIGEIGIYDEAGQLIPTVAMTEEGQLTVDEPDKIPEVISYMNTTYFDEIYHARTAYEYIHGMTVYEWTHPPLGKLIMTLPIRLWGMNPFSYRVAGNIAGLVMLIVIYIFGKRLFKETKYAALAMLLFAVDGMHFVQTRIGTVDSFLVLFIMLAYLFMYQYICCHTEKEFGKMHMNLFLSGLFMGAAIATKWNGAYSAIGLCLIFFANFAKRNREGYLFSEWKKRRIKVIIACCFYFVLIPAVIYGLSYIPDILINPEYGSIKGFIGLQQKMYHYHADLEATHPFSSPWYLWPLGVKPLWYYDGKVAEGMVSSIALHSNPFIWWTGIVAMLYTFIKAVVDRNRRYVYLTVVILAAYVPYMFIPRIMFIYHYFPIVPFMILAIVSTLKDLEEVTGKRWIKAYGVIAIIVFAFFYPIYSGLVIPEWYARLTEWLPVWQLY